MNAISSVGSSYGGSHVNSLQSRGKDGPGKQLEKELTSFLDAQGVSAEDQKSIKSELLDSISATLSAGGPPDPSKIQSTVQGVLDKHGIDGAGFVKNLPKPPPGFAGKPGAAGGSSGISADTDALQSLLDILAEQAENTKASSKEKSEVSSESEPSQSSEGSSQSNTSAVSRSTRTLDIQA